eukprot:3090553-Rhodomonas_salina.1
MTLKATLWRAWAGQADRDQGFARSQQFLHHQLRLLLLLLPPPAALLASGATSLGRARWGGIVRLAADFGRE